MIMLRFFNYNIYTYNKFLALISSLFKEHYRQISNCRSNAEPNNKNITTFVNHCFNYCRKEETTKMCCLFYPIQPRVWLGLPTI